MATARGKTSALSQAQHSVAVPRLRGSHYLATAGVLCLAYLLALPPNAYRSVQVLPPSQKLLELSWIADMESQLVNDRWAGRDFIYTYGPLRQILHGAGALVGSGDLATRLRFDRALVIALSIAGVWWLLLTTGASWNWRALLLLGWFGLDFDLHTKALAVTLIAAACGRSLVDSGRPSRRWQRIWPLLVWAGAAPLAMLYCFDIGVFLVGWSVLFVGLIAVLSRGKAAAAVAVRRRAIAMLASALIGMAAVCGWLFLLPAWRSYLRDSWQVALGYIGHMAYPISGVHLSLVVLAVVVAGATLAVSVHRLRAAWRRDLPVDPWLYPQLAVACLSLVWIRYGLTRSDPPHVLDAVLPGLFWWGCMVPAIWSARDNAQLAHRPSFAPFAMYLLPALLLGKALIAPESFSRSWIARWEMLVDPPRAATALAMDRTTERAVAAARELPGESLIVWPNESVIAQAAGKINPMYTLQSFMAMTEALERENIARLERLPDAPLLLARTGEDLDAVSHVSRAPRLFQFLIEHFQIAQSPQPEFAVLRRTGSQRAWRSQTVPLPPAGAIAKLTSAEVLSLPFGSSPAPVLASDLLMLRMSTSAAGWNPLAKAARLIIKLTLANGQSRYRFVPLTQGTAPQTIGVTYLEPSDELFVEAFFGQDVVQAAEPLSKLEIAWQPVDMLTPLPDELVLHEFDFVRRVGLPDRILPVSDSRVVSQSPGPLQPDTK